MTQVSVNTSQIIADLSDMVRCPSVNTFGAETDSIPEAAMADLFETKLRGLGLEVGSHDVSTGRRNIWGTLKGHGDGPSILLAGHLDTVGTEGYENPFDPFIKDGALYGRGSCDMKAGLAAYLEVIRILKQNGAPLSGDVIVAGVVDEEHAMVGSKHFGLHGPEADYAIVAEPTELKICPTHKGQILLTLRTKGLAAHSSKPDSGRNAVYHMASVLAALQDYAHELSQRAPDPECGLPSFSVGVIRGGDNACSVPDWCEIDIDRRTIPGETFDQVLQELHDAMSRATSAQPEIDYEICTPFLNLPPLATPHESPIVKAIQTACQSITGQVVLQTFPGSTDAPNYACPTIICGPGSLEQCHSLNEYVSIDQIEKAVRIYVQTILNLQADGSHG